MIVISVPLAMKTNQLVIQFDTFALQLRCNGVHFNHVNSDSRSAAWVSRGGQRELYWGGAFSRRPNFCACGETGKDDN